MLEIPVESLNLFEQLDRNVVAFYRNEEIYQTESLNISITQEHYASTFRIPSCSNTFRNGFR